MSKQRFVARLERKDEALPAFLMVPAHLVQALDRHTTFVVDADVDDRAIGRRSVKPWGDGRWFMEVTKEQLARLGLKVGDLVQVAFEPAIETPPELEAAIEARGLAAVWAQLTAAQRRAVTEPIFLAKRPQTRDARIARALTWLEQRP